MHQEHASATADAVWKFHTDAPVLGEIDRAIAQGGTAAAAGDAAGELVGDGLECRAVPCHAVTFCCALC